MTNCRFARLLALIVPLLLLLAAGPIAGGEPNAPGNAGNSGNTAQRPNIVLLLVDDLGYGEAGCYGGRDIPTPNIDALANNGVRMTNAYVSASYCAPSRAGLLTGRYQTRFGFEANPVGAANDDPRIGLPLAERTVADLLRDAGYATALVGKWHLGGTARFHPQRRGFDTFYGFLHEGHYYVPPPWEGTTTWLRRKTLPNGTRGRWTSPDGRVVWSTHLGYHEPAYDANNPILRNSQPVMEPEYLTDAITREAIRFIDRSAEQPFFLFVSYNAVHSPMQATDAYMEKFAHIEDIHRRIFAAMLAHLDDSVGRIVAHLRERDLEDDTLIVLLSDNGGPTRELTSSNEPLRGGKGQLYEGGIRVPMIVQWKATLPAGTTYHRPVSSLDLLPTFLAAAATPLPENLAVDGANLLPYLAEANQEPPHPTLYWRTSRGAALRHGDWKLVRHAQQGRPGNWELYNLGTDLSETRDQAREQPGRLADLVRRWEKLNSEMAEPAW